MLPVPFRAIKLFHSILWLRPWFKLDKEKKWSKMDRMFSVVKKSYHSLAEVFTEWTFITTTTTDEVSSWAIFFQKLVQLQLNGVLKKLDLNWNWTLKERKKERKGKRRQRWHLKLHLLRLLIFFCTIVFWAKNSRCTFIWSECWFAIASTALKLFCRAWLEQLSRSKMILVSLFMSNLCFIGQL